MLRHNRFDRHRRPGAKQSAGFVERIDKTVGYQLADKSRFGEAQRRNAGGQDTRGGEFFEDRLDRGRGRFGSALEISDRKSTRLNSSHSSISYAVFCLKKKT